jgi:predicted porin
MKKHLIAAAVAAAVAVPAMAQVTISGAIGGNSTKYKTSGATAASQSATTANDHLGTTALRISGAEDLGQGMKASFVLEGDLALSSGLGSHNTTSKKDNIFNRFANVSLSGAFGEVTIGRQNNTTQSAKGNHQFYNLSDNLHFSGQVSGRIANAYGYTTPSLNGFKVSAVYSNNPDAKDGSTADGSSGVDGNLTQSGFGASYTLQGISLAAAQMTIAQVGATDIKETVVSAKGKVAMVELGLGFVTSEQGSNELSEKMISAKASMGSADLIAHYVTIDVKGSGFSAKSGQTARVVDGDGFGIMGVYNLSKRTALYAGYADYDATGTATNDQTVSTVGLIHKF